MLQSSAGSLMPAKTVAKNALDLSLSQLDRAMMSALAERMFDNTSYLNDTTDSESEDLDRNEQRVFDWRTNARPPLLPFVGETIPETANNKSRELYLPSPPPYPWKVIKTLSVRRKASFQSGHVFPEKRRKGIDGEVVPPTNFSMHCGAENGKLVELLDEEGKIVELREKPDCEKYCCFVNCQNPSASISFKTVRNQGEKWGVGWTRFVGRTLCNTCYYSLIKRRPCIAPLSSGRSCASTGHFDDSPPENRITPHRKPVAVRTMPLPNPRCQVCFDAAKGSDLTCAKCGMTVHEQCYLGGIRIAANGRQRASWKCDPCSLSVATSTLECPLCPLTGGAFKRAAWGSEFKWAHLACAILIPGLYMMDDQNLDDIRGLENIPQDSNHQTCTVCLQLDSYFRVSCQHRGCDDTCHPHCGVRKGWEMQFVEDGEQLDQQYFCPRHLPSGEPEASAPEQGSKPALGKDEIRCPTCCEEWDGRRFMIRCDVCSGFYHGSCVLLSEEKAKTMSRFVCPKCPLARVAAGDASQQLQTRGDASEADPVLGAARDPAERDGQVFPGRSIMFQWNETDWYEGVVVCRASELRRRDGKRRNYGRDWWQVRWTEDGGSSKDIVMLAESNSDRWEVMARPGVQSQAAAELAAEENNLAGSSQRDGLKKRKAAPPAPAPFDPVEVFCAPNGDRHEMTYGLLRVSTVNPRKVVVDFEGREMALTDFEALAGNSGKRPKHNIRLCNTQESVCDFLSRNWVFGFPAR